MNDEAPENYRLDILLVEKKLAPTRSKARDLIRAGHVSVEGVITTKAGKTFSSSAAIKLASSAPDYISRGGIKLQHALEHFKLEVHGKVFLDLGASTGGFTEVLLRNGVAHVYAVDIGHSQLHESLQKHSKVTSMEGVDARSLKTSDFAHSIDGVVADLSFISLTKALAAPMKLIEKGGVLIALIKPQFELEKKSVGKGGIVRNPEDRKRALESAIKWLSSDQKWRIEGTCHSPIEGQHGNTEYLIAARRR